MNKKCVRCYKVKLLEEFHRNVRQKDGYNYYCKVCMLKKNKEDKYMQRYGITLLEKSEMIVAQGGKCSICENQLGTFTDAKVDHDHVSGKVRGILCNTCNHGLGNFKDNPKLLEAAILYLESWVF